MREMVPVVTRTTMREASDDSAYWLAFSPLERIANHDVRYLVVGGWALAAHGHPRMTKDLDIWVLPDARNAKAVVAALEEFGFADVGLTTDDFTQVGVVVQLGYPALGALVGRSRDFRPRRFTGPRPYPQVV